MSDPAAETPQPVHVRLRAYKVGFGDCLLLTVTYAAALEDGRTERHVLVDCGTVRGPEGGPRISEVAAWVAAHTSGRLDGVVATHRHKDHVGGFGDRGAQEALRPLAPSLVVRPWTDVPGELRAEEEFGLDGRHRRFLEVLDRLGERAEELERLAFDSDRAAERAAELAGLGFTNVAAIAFLEEWAHDARAAYVRAGETLDLADVAPGVHVEVLGPPTLDEVPALSRYAKDSEEYWLGLIGEAALADHLGEGGEPAREEARRVLAEPDGLGAAGWLLRTLEEEPLSQGQDIVDALDDVLNNTSVILLVTVGERRLLLPGDAQAENWSLTLDRSLGAAGRDRDDALARSLADVDLYKVGHHGSRNATPRRLTGHWGDRGPDRPVVSVLTTQSGVFGHSHEGAVPQPALVAGLSGYGPVHSTDELAADVWWMDLEAPAVGPATFTCTPGPPVGGPPVSGQAAVAPGAV